MTMSCQQCGSIKKIEEHHKIWKSKGGADTPENKIYLCRECHKRLHGKKKNSKHRLLIVLPSDFIEIIKSKIYLEGKTIKEKNNRIINRLVKMNKSPRKEN